jgi:single-stranded-DNA-specific exonuclease
VIDHHTPGATAPDAAALVNPHLGEDPGAHPCGVGVAFKVAWSLATNLAGGPRVAQVHRDYLTDALGLVALGTIADVVPLRDENRVFGRFGLEVLARTKRPGLRALIAKSEINGGAPKASDVGFRLAPRINAAGRLGQAELALELLMTDDADRGREIAAHLDRENRRRREIEAGILAEALAAVERDYEPGHPGGIVVGAADWHPGVIGIVAARLVDRFHRPAAVASFDGPIGRGSCRSIPAVRLPEILERCAPHLASYGGHAAAAGFSIEEENFEEFRRAFDAAVREVVTPDDLVRRIRVDVTASLGDVTPALVRDIDRLAPFGAGNPRPVIATRGVRVAGNLRRVGKNGEHLSFLASDGTASFRVIGFRMGPLGDRIGARSTVDIAYTPRFDDWRADGSLQLTLEDLTVNDG